MQAIQLITHMPVDDHFLPLAGSRFNTIRRFRGKYTGMQVGDNVVMHHTPDPKTKDVAVPLTEILRVSSYAVGGLDNIVASHGMRHHSRPPKLGGLKDYILSFYPLAEGEERNDSQLFVAIYF